MMSLLVSQTISIVVVPRGCTLFSVIYTVLALRVLYVKFYQYGLSGLLYA